MAANNIPDQIIERLKTVGVTVGARLGHGAYGSVWSCKLTDDALRTKAIEHVEFVRPPPRDWKPAKECALKYVEYDVCHGKRVRVETQALKDVSSPHLANVWVLMWGDDPKEKQDQRKKYVIYVMEKAERGSLDKYVESNRLSEEHARKIVTDLIRGLQELRNCGRVHGDIKEANVLVCDYKWEPFIQARLTDFETVREFLDERENPVVRAEMNQGRADDLNKLVALLERLRQHIDFDSQDSADDYERMMQMARANAMGRYAQQKDLTWLLNMNWVIKWLSYKDWPENTYN